MAPVVGSGACPGVPLVRPCLLLAALSCLLSLDPVLAAPEPKPWLLAGTGPSTVGVEGGPRERGGDGNGAAGSTWASRVLRIPSEIPRVLRGHLQAVRSPAHGNAARLSSPSSDTSARVLVSSNGLQRPQSLQTSDGGPTLPSFTPRSEIFPMCTTEEATVSFSAGDASGTVWKGWGTSLAWFANFIGRLNQTELDDLLDWLFDADKGLGLNIVRYNIGGGFNPEFSPQFDVTSGTQYHGVPGFLKEEGGEYDWTADAPQRAVLLGAKARGADKFIAFSNSAPWWMTVSKDVAGAPSKTQSNLKPEYFSAFADYLTEVVAQYATNPAWNVTFDYLEPVNEPVEKFWGKGGAQEGCTFQPRDIARILTLVGDSLASKNLSTQLVATDSWAALTGKTLREMDPSVVSSLAQVHSHGYVKRYTKSAAEQAQQVEWAYRAVRRVAANYSKEAWMTEWSPLLRYALPKDDIDLAMFMARSIVEAVNIMGASAWVYWQAIDYTAVFTLINIRWNEQSSWPHQPKKKYYTMLHWTRFATPGSVAIPPSSTDCQHSITSFYNEANSTLAVFVVNQQDGDKEVQVSVDGFQVADAGSASPVLVYRTSLTENMASQDPASEAFTASLQFTAIGRSLATLVFTNVQKPKIGAHPRSPRAPV